MTPSNWSSLFSSFEDKLHFVSPCTIQGEKSVSISKDVLDQGISMWDDCLLGKFVGFPPKLSIIQSLAEKLCGRYGSVEIIPLVGEGFLFKLSDFATLSRVLEGGRGF